MVTVLSIKTIADPIVVVASTQGRDVSSHGVSALRERMIPTSHGGLPMVGKLILSLAARPSSAQNEEPSVFRNSASSGVVSLPRIPFLCGNRPNRSTMSLCPAA